MKKNYYALVAGMPDVAADDAKPALSVAVFKEEYLPRLSAKDRKLAELVLLKYDNRNLLAYLRQGEEADFDTRAVYPREAWSEAMAQVKADDEHSRLFFISSSPPGLPWKTQPKAGCRKTFSPKLITITWKKPATLSCAIGSPSTAMCAMC